MIFKCRSCGGNVVYDPEHGRMHCPYCDGVDTQEPEAGDGQQICKNCGAPLEAGTFGSAVRCAYCGQYTILEERISEGYRPRFILPFRIGKKAATGRLQEEFKNRILRRNICPAFWEKFTTDPARSMSQGPGIRRRRTRRAC